MKTIQDVHVGDKINHHRNGEGMITDKTKRTITAVFENGVTTKLTYKTNDAYFYVSDF